VGLTLPLDLGGPSFARSDNQRLGVTEVSVLACDTERKKVTNTGRETMRTIFATTCALVGLLGSACAQQSPSGSTTDQDYMKRVMTAAPPQIVADATVVRMQSGSMQTLKKGSNEWTCMEANGVPMCMDPNAMEWAHAWQSHGPATDKTGFIYMLAGDTGASNTDPYATTKTADNHWIQTGSHVMIVGAAVKTMAGYAKNADADPTKPYVMWPGSPYEHLMIPVK
jgi:hypothetical protein